jgi:hypothetical protein
MTNPDTAVVEGVDVDALAAAVRSCPAVDDLDGGPLGTVATYLPGRRVPGIRIGADRASIQVRGKWDVPIRELAGQVLAAVAPLTGGRTIDILVADVAEPALPAPTQQGPAGHSRQLGARRQETVVSPPAEDNDELCTRTNAADAPRAKSSSAPTTPTGEETLPNS